MSVYPPHCSMSVCLRLCKYLSNPQNSISSSIGHSKGEAVLTRLQDACTLSSQQGRPFLSLCSLLDPKHSGNISRDELVMVSKMMEVSLTMVDVEALKEILSEDTITRENRVSYVDLYDVIIHFVAKDSATYLPRDFDGRSYSLRATGALPAYAIPGVATNPMMTGTSGLGVTMSRERGGGGGGGRGFNLTSGNMATSMSSPLHFPINNSNSYSDMGVGVGRRREGGGRGSFEDSILNNNTNNNNNTSHSTDSNTYTYSRIAMAVGERVQRCLLDKSRSLGVSVSLRRLLLSYDHYLNGCVLVSLFLEGLEEVGVMLTASELFAVTALYGRGGNSNDRDRDRDSVDYDSFCSEVCNEGNNNNINNYNNNNSYPHHNSSPSHSRPSSAPPHRPSSAPPSSTSFGGGGGGGRGGGYSGYGYGFGYGVTQRVRELQLRGIDIFDAFAQFDFNNSGRVSLFFFLS